MNRKVAVKIDPLYARLDEIRMSDHERLRARASLARAEAIADLLVAAIDGIKRVAGTLVIRPYRRLTEALG